MLRHVLKVALRNLRRHKGYAFINTAGLALGMAFAILVLLWVGSEVSYDRFHEDLDRLFMVAFTNESRDFFSDVTVGALARYLREEYPDVEMATRCSFPETWKLRHDGDNFYGRLRFVDPEFFGMFSFPFVEGDPKTALSEPNSMIITEDLAERIFGNADPIGKSLQGINQVDYTVTAVLREMPDNSRFKSHCFIPAEYGPAAYRQWDIKSLQTYVLLRDGADHEAVSLKIKDVYNIHNDQDTRNDQYLVPLRKVHLYSLDGRGGTIVYLTIFSIIGAAVLLIACINFINLSTARADVRFREIGVKKVVGAGRFSLSMQFMGESLLLSFVALLFAVVILEWAVPLVNSVLRLGLDFSYSWQTMLILLGTAMVTGLLSGSYPAIYLSSLKPAAVLNRQRPTGGGMSGLSLRRLLVIVQFTVTVVFMISVVVIFKQLNHVRTMDIGFQKDGIVLFNLPGELRSRAQTVKAELLNHEGIESTSVSSGGMFGWNTSFGIDWEGKQPGQVFDVGYKEVDHDYLDTLRMEMVDGRFFSRNFHSDREEAVVVNEALVKAMGVDDPVGRRVTIASGSSWERVRTIIGVIRNYHTETAHREIRPFMLGLSETGWLMCARIAPDHAEGSLRFIRKKIREMVPDAGVYCRFLRDELLGHYRVELTTGSVIIFIAVIAAAISCLGLFGLTAYTARRRTREIGIRKVLGATVPGILVMFMREIALLVLVSGVVGSIASYFIMNRWLENFVFRTGIGPALFIWVVLSAVLAATATVSVQAARAAMADPVDAIRQE